MSEWEEKIQDSEYWRSVTVEAKTFRGVRIHKKEKIKCRQK